MYALQNSINIMQCDGQTKLSVSIHPTKFGTVSVVEPSLPKTLQDVIDIMQSFSALYWDIVLL